MVGPSQSFGGDWTTEKPEHVREYLQAYTRIMNKQPFRYAYIDAFAGTGYVEFDKKEETNYGLLELMEEEPQRFIHGSARIALQVQPHFHRYIFIEKDERKCNELHQLKDYFPEQSANIQIIKGEANTIIQHICNGKNWTKHRAVLFLDPYGMQVRWETLAAVANTKAIDLWILFPLGVAVNRMLKKDGQINECWCNKLNDFFGTSDWYEVFYAKRTERGLFGTNTKTTKIVNIDDIGKYFVSRLKTIFTTVAENPLPLYNSRHNPLFLLCFAASNPRGAPIALKIAQSILKKR